MTEQELRDEFDILSIEQKIEWALDTIRYKESFGMDELNASLSRERRAKGVLIDCKEEIQKIKQQLEEIHYYSDAYCLYELEKNYNIEREDIKKVEYCGGHGYTAVRIHFSNGTSIYESDETLAGMLLAWARIKNIQG